MLHLLSDASIFVPIGNNNYQQVTGTSVLQVARAHGRASLWAPTIKPPCRPKANTKGRKKRSRGDPSSGTAGNVDPPGTEPATVTTSQLLQTELRSPKQHKPDLSIAEHARCREGSPEGHLDNSPSHVSDSEPESVDEARYLTQAASSQTWLARLQEWRGSQAPTDPSSSQPAELSAEAKSAPATPEGLQETEAEEVLSQAITAQVQGPSATFLGLNDLLQESRRKRKRKRGDEHCSKHAKLEQVEVDKLATAVSEQLVGSRSSSLQTVTEVGVCPCTGTPGPTQAGEALTQASTVGAQPEVDLTPSSKRKRSRPSSWQRRKAAGGGPSCIAQMGELQMTEPLSQEAGTAVSGITADKKVIRCCREAPPTAPLKPTKHSKNLVARRGCKIKLKGLGKGSDVEVLNPNESRKRQRECLTRGKGQRWDGWKRVLPRGPVFYSAGFARKAGLPPNHKLRRCGTGKAAAWSLYIAIFQPKDGELASLESSRSPSLKTVHPVLPLLESMAERAATCPYSRLLARHCTLPKKDPPPPISTPLAGPKTTADSVEPGNPKGGRNHPRQVVDDITRGDVQRVKPAAAVSSQQAVAVEGMTSSQGQPECLWPGLGASSPLGVGEEPEDRPSSPEHQWEAAESGYCTQEDMMSSASDDNDSAFCPHHQVLSQPCASVVQKELFREGPLCGADVRPPGGSSEDDSLWEVLSGAREGGPHQGGSSEAGGSGRGPKAGLESFSYEELVTQFCSHRQVAAFVWSTVCRIVPAPLLGGPHGRGPLRRLVNRFVRLRLGQGICLHQALFKLPLRDFRCLFSNPFREGGTRTPPLQAQKQRQLLGQWVGWLLGELVVPLLRRHFYATEAEGHSQRVFYFRKPVWARLVALSLERLGGQGGVYRAVEGGEVRRSLEAKGRLFGPAPVRFKPKPSGIRPIAKLSVPTSFSDPPPAPRHKRKSPPPASSSGLHRPGAAARAAAQGRQEEQNLKRRRDCTEPPLTFRAANFVLRDLHACFKAERARRGAELTGGSVSGQDDVHARLRQFVVALRGTLDGGGPLPPLFLAGCDIRAAFDTMPQKQLLQVAASALSSPQYQIVVHGTVAPTLGAVRSPSWQKLAVPGGSLSGLAPLSGAATPPPSSSFQQVIVGATKQKSGGAVFVDQYGYTVQRAKLLRQLQELLLCSYVSLGGGRQSGGGGKNRYFQQTRGIAQGSVLSVFLCCLFYAHLERHCLLPLLEAHPAEDGGGVPRGGGQSVVKDPPGGTLLMRWVDDSLLISTRRAVAVTWVNAMHAGSPNYGAAANPNKTTLSFDLDPRPSEREGPLPPPPNSRLVGGVRKSLPWCGLLLNVQTLEVQVDYSRLAGEHLSDSVVVDGAKGKGGHTLAARLCFWLRAKCSPLLLDGAINSPFTIRLNIYQAFLIAAMRMHCLVVSLASGGGNANPQFLFAAICHALGYMAGVVRAAKRAAQRRGSDCSGTIPAAHVRWLGLAAFQKALGRKQSRYRKLLGLLREEQKGMPRQARLRRQLESVTEDRHSEALRYVIY